MHFTPKYRTIMQALDEGGFEGFLDWLEQQDETLTFSSCDCYNCPVARWLTEETEAVLIQVGTTYIYSKLADDIAIRDTDIGNFIRWSDKHFSGYFTVRELRQAMSQAVIPTQPWLLSPIKRN